VQDLWNTMLLPTVLMLLARYAPQLMTGRAAANAFDVPLRLRQDEPKDR
jgi:hypothetical protein